MRSSRFAPVLLGVIAALSGCSKSEAPKPVVATPPPPPSIEIVKEQERSRHFMAVSKQLELGGTLYGYVDVDGDDRKVGDKIRSLMRIFGSTNPQLAMAANQDYTAIFQALGLDDIKALGVSSVPDGTGFFRNRLFVYTPNGRTGLLASGGGKPGNFAHLALAGADTDFYTDADIDASEIYKAMQKIARDVGGQTASNALETQLQNAGTAASLSILGLFENLKGNMALVMRVSDTGTISVPRSGEKPFIIPKFDVTACVDGIGSVIEPALARSPKFRADTSLPVHYYTEIADETKDLGIYIAIDGSTVYCSTSRAYLDACMKKPDGLRTDPLFKDALAHVGNQGNGLCYISPHLYKSIKTLSERNPDGPLGKMLASVNGDLPSADRGAISVRINLPDGILLSSYQDRSFKPLMAALAVYNPVTLGLLVGFTYQQKMAAAAAAGAGSRNRVGSPTPIQPLTPDMIVKRNLRVLYTLGVLRARGRNETQAAFAEIVGPDKAIKSMPSVEGEDYTQLVVHVGQPLKVTLSDGRVIDYTPPTPKKASVPASGP